MPDGMDPEDIGDPYLTTNGAQSCASLPRCTCGGFWDRTFKADGTPAHFFWEVARVESNLIRPAITLDQNSAAYDHSTTVTYTVGPLHPQIDRITARVRMRALPYEVLDDLIASGDLDPSIRAELKTLDIKGANSEWLRTTKGTGPAINTNCNPR